MPLALRTHDDVRHLACDACGWSSADLTACSLPSQVWHAFELDHDDAASGCAPIVGDPQLRARYEEAFSGWSAVYADRETLPLPYVHRLRLAS
ncbi:hypothetical protein [Naasia lichenicola]|uniref:Uncharacterized protein n=1 Tax=Naasia lichenicola TaxID=2565933 RepID=A0A4S4FSM2_9MICO|nr:hypothetical protein [Naasia lichenicola]THG33301.1 hypothetical protein E6C64_02815 [Naasia lichenicola]